tara:strand:- start:640 stop:843 length:204 start_codon:yes stop_codon:yes gene_type:complete
MIHELRHGIKLMKWSRKNGRPAWIFAKGWTVRGWATLWLRGYRPHQTMFGTVMRKDITTGNNSNTPT